MTLWIYPGSFDPMTMGHMDIIERGAKLCDRLIVGVLNNTRKRSVFTVEERVAMLQEAVAPFGNVSVESFNGLLAEYANGKNASAILRGLRSVIDFEYEREMALCNHVLNGGVDTVFLQASSENSYISSSMVKEICLSGGTVKGFVPDCLLETIMKKLSEG